MKSNKQTKDPIVALETAMEKIASITGAIYARDDPIRQGDIQAEKEAAYV